MSITKVCIQAWLDRLSERFDCLGGCEFSIIQQLTNYRSSFLITIRPETPEQFEAIQVNYPEIQSRASELKISFIPLPPNSTFDLQQWAVEAEQAASELSKIYNQLKEAANV